MSNELRLSQLKKAWMEIQALRDEQKELKDKIRPMQIRIRQNGQEIGKRLDAYNKIMV